MEKTKNALTVAMRANSNSRFGRENLQCGDADYARELTLLSRTKNSHHNLKYKR